MTVVIAKMGTTSIAENFGAEAVDEIYGSMKHIGPREFRERRVEHMGKAPFQLCDSVFSRQYHFVSECGGKRGDEKFLEW